MLNLPHTLKIYLGVESVDMRKSFNGLYALAKNKFEEDPLDGALFVFSNSRRNRLKLLYWDGNGLWVCAKRLEKGTFSWPRGVNCDKGKFQLEPEALTLLLNGIDLRGAKLRPWYQR